MRGRELLGASGGWQPWWALRGGLARVRGAAVGKGDGVQGKGEAAGGRAVPCQAPASTDPQGLIPLSQGMETAFISSGSIPEQVPGESCSPAQVVKDFLEASLRLHISGCCTAPSSILPPHHCLPVQALLPALAPHLPSPSLAPDLSYPTFHLLLPAHSTCCLFSAEA